MKQIHIIIIIALLLLNYTCSGQRTWHKGNVFFLPMLFGATIKDPTTAKKHTMFIGVFRVGYEHQLHKTIFAGIMPNILLIRGNNIQNGTGYGIEAGIRKFWNIEIYNRMCKPVFKDKFLISSKINFMTNNYYFDFTKGEYILGKGSTDYGVNLFPVCLDLKIYKKIYFSYQYNINLFSRSNLRNHNLGFSYLIKNEKSN